jgi:hypothetical protein
MGRSLRNDGAIYYLFILAKYGEETIGRHCVLDGIVLEISKDRRALESSETTQPVTQCHIPEQLSFQQRQIENLISPTRITDNCIYHSS